MPLLQNNTENGESCFAFIQTAPNLLQKMRHDSSRSVPEEQLCLSHHPHSLLKATNGSFSKYPTWRHFEKRCPHAIHQHGSCGRWQRGTRSTPEDRRVWQSKHQTRNQNPANDTEVPPALLHFSFPICKENFFFLPWEHVHYGHGVQKRQRILWKQTNSLWTFHSPR